MNNVSDHIVKAFDDQLNTLNDAVIRMGGLTESHFESALKALRQGDNDLARRVIESDSKINDLEIEVYNAAVRLLALRQPMAVDLRRVVAAFKMSIDLERIGDYSVNIAKRSIVLSGMKKRPAQIDDVVELAGPVQANLRDAIDAYTSNDIDKALDVWRRDADIDILYGRVIEGLVDAMHKHPKRVAAGTHLLFIAKNVERVGDHATNVAETVQYQVTGEFVEDDRLPPDPMIEDPEDELEAELELNEEETAQ